MDIHLKATAILDYRDATIERLVVDRGWREIPERDRIGAVYDFVRDEIRFGYNESDELSASQIHQGDPLSPLDPSSDESQGRGDSILWFLMNRDYVPAAEFREPSS